MKQLLSSIDLIEHMKNKGITFQYDSEQEAIEFLENHNYFFKLYAYRANYQKKKSGPNKGQYIQLDFAYLKELSILDYHLRELILNMSLNLEHALKVMLIKDIEENPLEDGYNLVRVWDAQSAKNVPGLKSQIQKIEAQSRTSYCQNLIRKNHGHPYPVWVVCELISFGVLCNLIKVYDRLYPGRIPFDVDLLFHIRDIRNAAAHSNCLINDLTPARYAFNLSAQGTIITKQISGISEISQRTRIQKLSNKPIYDFVVLLYLFPKIVHSTDIKAKTKKALLRLFLTRMNRHKDYFLFNATITTTYRFLIYVIRHFLLTK